MFVFFYQARYDLSKNLNNFSRKKSMCGLAGYYNLSHKPIVDGKKYLFDMQQTMQHRGPDGYRSWLSDDQNIGFVHRRLSIVDLSDAGFQPMFNNDKSIIVMCNGEIYNHPLLRTELEELGYRYRSQSDTETIVYAYQQWGINFLNKLNGMFAIVLYDQNNRELYLIRDRLGIKPLYFSLCNTILSFASEIKALWALPWMHKTINQQALYHYLTYLVTPAPMTLYNDMYKLPAGYYAKIDCNNKITFHEWYNPLDAYDPKIAQRTEHEHIETIRSLLRSSIKQQTLSDVPYGVFLSGGIDSSLNVALMSEFDHRVKTFTVSFADGPEYSEREWALRVAHHFNTDHHEIVITEKEAFEFFERMVYYQDEPLADCVCVPLYYVAKLLKDSGVTVVQVGEGSDELFCGYSTYAQYLDFYHRYWKHSQRYIPAFAKKSAYQIVSTLFPEQLKHRDIIKNWAHNKHLFWSGAIAFAELWKQDFIYNFEPKHDRIIAQIYPEFEQNNDSYVIPAYHLQQLYKRRPHADFLTSMIYLELKQRLPELLLMRVDKMAMATSVEGRVPFLDHRLVEYSLNMPSEYKYHHGVTKYILKKAAEGILPHDIIYRKKMGFAAPTKRWFKKGNYFKPYFLDLLQSNKNKWQEYLNIPAIEKLMHNNQNNAVDYSVQLWTLQNVMAQKI